MFRRTLATLALLTASNPAIAADLACQALRTGDRASLEQAFAAYLGRPPQSATAVELRNLNTAVQACRTNLGSDRVRTIEDRTAILRAEEMISRWLQEAQVRQGKESLDARNQATAHTDRSRLQAVLTALETVPDKLASADPSRDCTLDLQEMRFELSKLLGKDVFDQQVLGSPVWKRVEDTCTAKRTRLSDQQETAGADAEKRQIEADAKAAQAFASGAAAKHGAEISRLDINPDFLKARIVIERVGNWVRLSDWLAMVLDSNPGVGISASFVRELSSYGISIKIPGQRTRIYYFRNDGGELFLSFIHDGINLSTVTARQGLFPFGELFELSGMQALSPTLQGRTEAGQIKAR